MISLVNSMSTISIEDKDVESERIRWPSMESWRMIKHKGSHMLKGQPGQGTGETQCLVSSITKCCSEQSCGNF